jgi:pilus assembly protein CpaE
MTMSANNIRLMIVDDTEETRDNIRRLLSMEEGIEVVDEARNGIEAIEKAQKWKPDIILMDINMPEMDGIAATEKITLRFPRCSIIVISVQGDQDYLRRAMQAGAKDYLIKPFNPDQLVTTITNVYQTELKRKMAIFHNQMLEDGLVTKPKVIPVYSAKGGVGKSTIAVNLAMGLHEEGRRVALIDLNFLFGDIALMLNVQQRKTIYHAISDLNTLDPDGLENDLLTTKEGLRVLAAPTLPEQSELITAQHVERILRLLKERFDYIVIDCPSNFHETVLVTLEQADYIILVTNRNLHTVKNNKLFIQTMDTLNYDKNKVRLVVNDLGVNPDLSNKDLEDLLGVTVFHEIKQDSQTVDASINHGVPILLGNENTKAYRDMDLLITRIIELDGRKKSIKKKKKWAIFS